MSRFFALLALSADVAVVGTLAAVGVTSRRRVWERLQASFGSFALPLAWLTATGATLGSLYYSEIVGFTPCRLCWYQRIAMYPLVVILGIATVGTRDLGVRRYVVPLAAIGALISIYHYTLQWFPEFEATSCDPQAPCAAFLVREFGFVSIPFMALSGFLLIMTALLVEPTDGPPRESETS